MTETSSDQPNFCSNWKKPRRLGTAAAPAALGGFAADDGTGAAGGGR